MPKPSQSFFVYRIQSTGKYFTEKELFIENENFLTAIATPIKKDPQNQ